MTKRYAMIIGKEIVQTLQTPFMHVECEPDVFDDTHFFDEVAGMILQKAPLDYTLGIEGFTATLTGLPSGLTVEANGMNTTTDEEPLMITFDVPGTYRIELSGLVEYLDDSLEVTVGDA